jgi:hypothetical protein
MIWTEQRIKYLISDLTDENLFACHTLLSDLSISFTDEVNTLTISLEDRPELLLNPAFLQQNIHNEADFKVIILHEYLHLLYGMKYQLDSPLSHLTLDVIINAAICRQVPYYQRDHFGQSDSFFSRFYSKKGAAKFLRGNETEHRFNKLLRHFGEILKEEYLTDIILLGNHEKPRISDKYVPILRHILENMNPDDIRNRSFTSNEDLEYIEQHGHQMRHINEWQAQTYALLEEMISQYKSKVKVKKENRIRVYLDHNGFMENEMNCMIPLLEKLKADIDLPIRVFTTEKVKPAIFPEGYLLVERNGTKNLSLIIQDMRKNVIKGAMVITCGRHLKIDTAAILEEEQLGIKFLVSKMGNKVIFEENGLAFELLEPLILLENSFKLVKKPTVILNEGTVNK